MIKTKYRIAEVSVKEPRQKYFVVFDTKGRVVPMDSDDRTVPALYRIDKIAVQAEIMRRQKPEIDLNDKDIPAYYRKQAKLAKEEEKNRIISITGDTDFADVEQEEPIFAQMTDEEREMFSNLIKKYTGGLVWVGGVLQHKK